MARRPSGIERSTLNIRVEKSLRDRIEAVAYHARVDTDLTPGEINLSEQLRNVLMRYVQEYEKQVSKELGGADGRTILADQYAQAVEDEARTRLQMIAAARRTGRKPGSTKTK